jgi:outer membrane protein OmpA-like peptidoglycan-associated protein
LYKLDIIEPALDSLFNDESLFLVITGHTDNEGNEQYNMQLSQARADVVRDIFIRKGLDEGRISTVAYGENMPLKNNVTESGRQHNRRVEVHVLRNKQP